jgi:glutaredoxin
MKRFATTLLLLAGLCAVVPAGAARMYKITDENGNVTYTTRPPSAAEGAQVETTNISGGEGFESASAKMDEIARDHPVTLYVVAACAGCDLARSYLNKHHIPFTSKDVNKDAKAKDELKKVAGSLSVPTITIGDKVLNGYLESVLEQELAAVGYPVGKNAPAVAPAGGEEGEANADQIPGEEETGTAEESGGEQ